MAPCTNRKCKLLMALTERDDDDYNDNKDTHMNHKGLQRTANEYAEERRIYKDLISKNNNVNFHVVRSALQYSLCRI